MLKRRASELPTLFVAVTLHLSWLSATWFVGRGGLPHWSLAPLALVAGFLVAWHGSLQHEIIHGHPTRWRAVNEALAFLPLGLWLPFGVYRDLHVAHHRSPHLTDPLDDPESFYVTREWWNAAGPVRRAIARAGTTLLGRLVLGPPVVVVSFLAKEVRAFARRDFAHARAWALHLAGVAIVLAWVVLVCELPVGLYLLCFVYPGTAMTLLRSFAEHRPAEQASHRIGIVEAGPVARLLFLNNNFHVVHHENPDLPWYELGRRYAAERDEVLADNGGFVFSGYLALVARYGLRAKDSPVHPHR